MYRCQFYMLTLILIFCLIVGFDHQTNAKPIKEVIEVDSMIYHQLFNTWLVFPFRILRQYHWQRQVVKTNWFELHYLLIFIWGWKLSWCHFRSPDHHFKIGIEIHMQNIQHAIVCYCPSVFFLLIKALFHIQHTDPSMY